MRHTESLDNKQEVPSRSRSVPIMPDKSQKNPSGDSPDVVPPAKMANAGPPGNNAPRPAPPVAPDVVIARHNAAAWQKILLPIAAIVLAGGSLFLKLQLQKSGALERIDHRGAEELFPSLANGDADLAELAVVGPFSRAGRTLFFSDEYIKKFHHSWVPRSPGQYFSLVSPNRAWRFGMAWEG